VSTRIGTINAILVDPTARTVSAIELPLYTGDECCGHQIDLRDVKPIIGADFAEITPLPNGDSGIVDESGLLKDPHIDCFELGEYGPFVGKCVVAGWERNGDAWHDCRSTVDDIQRLVTWSRRIVRGFDVTEAEQPGLRTIRVAPVLPKIDGVSQDSSDAP
jgi:hypothetical protein